MATVMKSPDGVEYTDYLSDQPESMKNEKRALLAMMAEHGTEGQAEYINAQQAAQEARRNSIELAAARGMAINAPSTLQASMEQNYDKVMQGLTDNRTSALLGHGREMDRIAAANAAYLDAVGAAAKIAAAQAAAANRRAAGGGGGGGGGGDSYYVPPSAAPAVTLPASYLNNPDPEGLIALSVPQVRPEATTTRGGSWGPTMDMEGLLSSPARVRVQAGKQPQTYRTIMPNTRRGVNPRLSPAQQAAAARRAAQQTARARANRNRNPNPRRAR